MSRVKNFESKPSSEPVARDINELAKLAAQEVDAGKVIRLTQELVRIRSVYEPGSPGGNEKRAAEYVAQLLMSMNLEVHIEEVAPGRPNVIADWKGSGFSDDAKTLMFEGHTDVVTEGDASEWTYDPFSAKRIGERIYGRGSADMKAGVAAAICAVEAVSKVAPNLPGRIRLGIVVDEEGMMSGIKHFIKQGWADEVDGAIVCEPEENEICLFQKGAMRVAVTVRGVMAHGAMPYAGVNPIPRLAEFIRHVEQFEKAEQSRLGNHEYLGLPWMTPTIVRAPVTGEPQINVMPRAAFMTLDIRTVPGQDHKLIMASLREIGVKLEAQDSKVKVELELIEERPWTETPSGDPLVRAVERAFKQTLGTEPAYGGVPGATDGTFLHAWANIPVVTIGPGDRTIPHQRDEFVDAQDVITAARLYAASAIFFLTGSNPT
jgi:succinyl-diaminopimelate desuccinylase